MRRAANVVDSMGLLPQLHDPQSELLLLRSCKAVILPSPKRELNLATLSKRRNVWVLPSFFFGLRTCQPVHMEEAALFFDKGLRGSIENMVVCGGPFFGDLQWRLSSLPIRFGGLDFGICGMYDDYVSALNLLRNAIPSFDFSCFTNKDTATSKAQQTLASALFCEMAKDMEVHFDMTVRRARSTMSPVEYHTILKYRLMIPLFSVDEICLVCRKACLDSFGEHAVHCKELPGFKYRHDMVRDVLFDVCRRAGISAKKEAPVNFLTGPLDGRSTLKPADILIFGWVGGKYTCVDLTGVSPLVGLSSRGFTVGQTALKVASCKVTRHENACIKNQHVFVPFVSDNFGFLAPEAMELLNRVQRIGTSDINLSHLFFAADVVIITEWSTCDMDNIIRIFQFPFIYLGLPIGSTMSFTVNWKILVDKFHSKLFSWKTSLLSFGGRLTLIKAVLRSLGSQGSKKLAWMKWSNILASFDKGDSLWVKVIRALHGSEGGFDHNGCRFNGLWSRIVGSSNYLHSSSILPMDSIRFQALSVGTREEFSDYRSYSQCQIEVGEDNDKCVWFLAHDGVFSVGDLCRRIDDHILPSVDTKMTWDKSLPRKVNIFMWRLKLDRLPHRLHLSSRGIDIPKISCPSCSGNVETNHHIFFDCVIAKEVWKIIWRWCDEAFPLVDSNTYWIDWLDS
ncbi:putative reverse transcriptase domain-containing protein [Tanacetum coccineum]